LVIITPHLFSYEASAKFDQPSPDGEGAVPVTKSISVDFPFSTWRRGQGMR